MEKTVNSIGLALMYIRVKNKDTQKKLCKKINGLVTKVFSQEHISRIEHNKSIPSNQAMIAYRELYKIRILIEYTDLGEDTKLIEIDPNS